MAKYSIEDTTLTNIAEAIRTKGNTTESLTPLQMPDAINAIQTGGGAGEETIESLIRTPEEVYETERPSDWPVLPEPTQNNEFYFLCKTYKKNYVILPYCGSNMTVEWGYIDDNGAFVVVHSYNQGNALTYWSETSITSKWVSPQMDKYYVMRTTGTDCSREKAGNSSTANSSTMKYVLEVKARVKNPFFMSPTSDSSYYTNGMTGCQFITLYGPQEWTTPAYKFNKMKGLRALLFKDDNPFARYNATTDIKYIFNECYSLETPHYELFKNWTAITTTGNAYYKCHNLKAIDLDLTNNTALIQPTTMFNYVYEIKRVRIRAPHMTKGQFFSAYIYDFVIEECDLSNHEYIYGAYYMGQCAREILNLKLKPIDMTSNNIAYYGTSSGEWIRRITMAPDATENNVPTTWKVCLKYAGYTAIEEFVQSLPTTSTTRAITIVHHAMGSAADVPPSLSALAVSKGYTLAFSAT